MGYKKEIPIMIVILSVMTITDDVYYERNSHNNRNFIRSDNY
jgi:hypothetical protein